MAILRVQGPAVLRGHVVAPADKSITHRALILAALGEGVSEVAPAGHGADNRSTAAVLRALGVSIDERPDGYVVQGAGGPEGFKIPDGPLDCGNSGTTIRLMSGVLAANPGPYTLDGDGSLRRRPMARLLPLGRMGARLRPASPGADEPLRPPFIIEGGALNGADHDLKVASAQVKSALLLAGLFADGPTRVREPGRSRDHTERALRALGVRLEEAPDGTLTVWPRSGPWRAPRIGAAPDLSSAAFWLGAATMTDSRDLCVQAGVNPTRAGVIDALRAFGVPITITPIGDVSGEPVADLVVAGPPVRAARLEGTMTLRSIDEIPLLAAVAALAPGRTVIRDAAELRVKETDRIDATVGLLTAFGVPAEATEDGLVVEGGHALRPAEVDGSVDHRIAMTAAVLGLAAPGWTTVHGAEIINVSYPGFADVLARLGAQVQSA